MIIGIIGLGTVGRAMCHLFDPYAEIVTYDVTTGKDYPKDELAGCDFAVICVDTPTGADGSCDTTNVEAAVAAVPLDKILIRSTIAPGTTDRLVAETGKEICFSPEYLGEHTYADTGWGGRAEDVPFLVIGGVPATRTWFLDRLVALLGPARTYFQCTAIEAEVIKYMENAFLATKVAFVNEFYEICRAVGAEWHTVREGWLLDPRIGRSHSAVFVDRRGFGAKCLPKDLRAIVAASTSAGYRPELLAEVLESNERHRHPA
jgi:nucleotide sugar dehydrogenase